MKHPDAEQMQAFLQELLREHLPASGPFSGSVSIRFHKGRPTKWEVRYIPTVEDAKPRAGR